MNDPRQAALLRLDGVLRRAARQQLQAHECIDMIEQLRLVPGYAKRVAHALSAQRSAAGVEALRCMPPGVPGVVEGIHQAFFDGVSRVRLDGSDVPRFLAVDFRQSRSRRFEDLLDRGRSVFAEAFEILRVGGRVHFRFTIQASRGTVAGRAAAVTHDLQYLHERLSRLKGTRLWVNGWCFPSNGPFSSAVQVHFVRAWLGWAARQTATRR